MAEDKDGYKSWRVSTDDMRICFQHYCWLEQVGYNLHSSIKLPSSGAFHIAEVAAGHCIWSLQVAQQLGPNCQIEASDLSLNLAPPKTVLPPNVRTRAWNFFDPVPEDWVGKFDVVHVRLIGAAFQGGQDPRLVLEKFKSMLKPGGYLQWGEYEYDMSRPTFEIVADPARFPEPKITHPSTFKLFKLVSEDFDDLFRNIPKYLISIGFEDIIEDQKPTNPIAARAFFECWLGSAAQLVGIYDRINPEKGQQLRILLKQIYKDWEDDDIIAVPLPKVVVARKKV